MNRLQLTLAILILHAAAPVKGLVVDTFVTSGRWYLTQKDLVKANANFAAGVNASPEDARANFFHGVTRLLVLTEKPEVKAFLDRVGISETNRNVYAWRTTAPKDTNGVYIAPRGVSAQEAIEILRTIILPEIEGALENFRKVADPNFTLELTAAETTALEPMTVDYGDVLLLRSMLELCRYICFTLGTWDFDVQLSSIRTLYDAGNFSAEQLLLENPSLFTFTSTNELAKAREGLINAGTTYVSASEFIRGRPTNEVRLFTWDPEQAEEEQSFRATVNDVLESVHGPVVLREYTNLTVNAGMHFELPIPLRDFLPEFKGDRVIAGGFPDATFGGTVLGLSAVELEKMTARRGVEFVSRFGMPLKTGSGRVSFALDALEGAEFLLQVSSDLWNWSDMELAKVTNGVLTFSDAESQQRAQRFYRAVDISKVSRITGRVLSVATEEGITGGTIRIRNFQSGKGSVESAISETGEFVLYVPKQSPSDLQSVEISAPGYDTVEHTIMLGEGTLFMVPFYIAPTGYRPPNDDFSQSIAVTGSVRLEGNTMGGTVETAMQEPNTWLQTIWWSWKAPTNGMVQIENAEMVIPASIEVFRGDSLASLTGVPYSGNSFFVEHGAVYHIRVGGYPPGHKVAVDIRFTELNGPFSLSGKAYRLATDGGQRGIRFVDNGRYEARWNSLGIENGRYGFSRTNDLYTVTAFTSDIFWWLHKKLTLNFTSPTNGTFRLEYDTGAVETGTFEERGWDDINWIEVPTGLAGKIINFSLTSGPYAGGNYNAHFIGSGSGSFTISGGSVGAGTFRYTPDEGAAVLVLTYVGAEAGDIDSFDLKFNSPTNGTFSGTHIIGQQTYNVTGEFSVRESGGENEITAPAGVDGMAVQIRMVSGPFMGAVFDVHLAGSTSGTFTISGGSTGSGTFTYIADGSEADLVLTYVGAEAGDVDSFSLKFTATTGGAFTAIQLTGEQTHNATGDFILREDGPNEGLAPPGVSGRVINFVLATGPFAGASYNAHLTGSNSGTFTISGGSVGAGTFTYNPNGNTASMVFIYTGAETGDRDDFTLTFTSATQGTVRGTQVTGNQTHEGSGTFQFVN